MSRLPSPLKSPAVIAFASGSLRLNCGASRNRGGFCPIAETTRNNVTSATVSMQRGISTPQGRQTYSAAKMARQYVTTFKTMSIQERKLVVRAREYGITAKIEHFQLNTRI